MWFIGLQFDKSEVVNIDLTTDIRIFIETVRQTAIQSQRYREDMKIDTKHVKQKELSSYLSPEVLKKTPKSGKPPASPVQIRDGDINSTFVTGQEDE
ncbi:poly(A) polymerase type 3-like isoform X1, partial [Dinothrombium tinctorium]